MGSVRPRWPLMWVFVLCFLWSCGGGGAPLDGLRRQLDRYPEYSVILEDMRSTGLFFHDYFHRYRLLWLAGTSKENTPVMEQKLTDWVKVDQSLYDQYQDALGMAVLTKGKDGSISKTPQPPGFQFVGDPRFGQWKTDDQGQQVWMWVAGAMVMSELLDEVGDAFERRRPRIRYQDWQDYRRETSRGTPYYGRRDASSGRPWFGTKGTVTEKRNPSFFERQQARMAERTATFGQKVESRLGRSRVSSSHSRAGSSGK